MYGLACLAGEQEREVATGILEIEPAGRTAQQGRATACQMSVTRKAAASSDPCQRSSVRSEHVHRVEQPGADQVLVDRLPGIPSENPAQICGGQTEETREIRNRELIPEPSRNELAGFIRNLSVLASCCAPLRRPLTPALS